MDNSWILEEISWITETLLVMLDLYDLSNSSRLGSCNKLKAV